MQVQVELGRTYSLAAALALQAAHDVAIYTSHHRDDHCFVETKDGTLPRPVVIGDWLPRQLLGAAA